MHLFSICLNISVNRISFPFLQSTICPGNFIPLNHHIYRKSENSYLLLIIIQNQWAISSFSHVV